ncbi:MAG: sodium/glutamate symporter, partial [Planctomycetota bacterium]|nr:sodium/glutamate symporter [Planctomycetota bacterium]
MDIEIAGVDFLILSIVVLYLGQFLTRRISILGNNNIPPAVTGGLVCSGMVALLHTFSDMTITFDMAQRDLLLLVFFSTIGLGAKFRSLLEGGKALGLLLGCATVFLIVQNTTGVGLAMLFGAHPGYGLFAGSVS